MKRALNQVFFHLDPARFEIVGKRSKTWVDCAKQNVYSIGRHRGSGISYMKLSENRI
jgi:hypothetical protein